jgi:hypothetical protein
LFSAAIAANSLTGSASEVSEISKAVTATAKSVRGVSNPVTATGSAVSGPAGWVRGAVGAVVETSDAVRGVPCAVRGTSNEMSEDTGEAGVEAPHLDETPAQAGGEELFGLPGLAGEAR